MTTLLTNATLLPCTPDMKVIERGWVRVEGETIHSLGAGTPPAVEGAEVIDASGLVGRLEPGGLGIHGSQEVAPSQRGTAGILGRIVQGRTLSPPARKSG